MLDYPSIGVSLKPSEWPDAKWLHHSPLRRFCQACQGYFPIRQLYGHQRRCTRPISRCARTVRRWSWRLWRIAALAKMFKVSPDNAVRMLVVRRQILHNVISNFDFLPELRRTRRISIDPYYSHLAGGPWCNLVTLIRQYHFYILDDVGYLISRTPHYSHRNLEDRRVHLILDGFVILRATEFRMISNALLGGAPTTWFANSRAAFASGKFIVI
jgi:hypothetical protein